MTSRELSQAKRSVIEGQVKDLLGRSQSYADLPEEERAKIFRHTADVVSFLSKDGQNPLAPGLARASMETVPRSQMAPMRKRGNQPVGYTSGGNVAAATQMKAQAMREGIAGTAELVREVDFPAFVAELIRGTFQAIVDASIQQMRAYGELVESIAMSLNDFRDENVSKNQARDSLLSKYPDMFQLQVDNEQPVLTPREGAGFGDLPNFQSDLGLDEEVTDLDQEVIEGKLVPAEQTRLARSRQRLLATMVMMGINRIIVTDGRINAKVRFNFSTTDRMTSIAQNYDWANMGLQIDERQMGEHEYEGSQVAYEKGKLSSITGAKRYTTDAYRYSERPVIKLAAMSQTQTEGQIIAAGQMAGEVSIKFKSETFPLERMLETGQLTRIQSAGRGTPAQTAPTQAAPAPAQAAPATPAAPQNG